MWRMSRPDISLTSSGRVVQSWPSSFATSDDCPRLFFSERPCAGRLLSTLLSVLAGAKPRPDDAPRLGLTLGPPAAAQCLCNEFYGGGRRFNTCSTVATAVVMAACGFPLSGPCALM